jgi:hypothetical protein
MTVMAVVAVVAVNVMMVAIAVNSATAIGDPTSAIPRSMKAEVSIGIHHRGEWDQ